MKNRLYALFLIVPLSFVGLKSSEDRYKCLEVELRNDIRELHNFIKNKEGSVSDFYMQKGREREKKILQMHLEQLSDLSDNKDVNITRLKNAIIEFDEIVRSGSFTRSCYKTEFHDIERAIDPKGADCNHFACCLCIFCCGFRNSDLAGCDFDYWCCKPTPVSDEILAKQIEIVRFRIEAEIENFKQREQKTSVSIPQVQVMDRGNVSAVIDDSQI